MGTPPLRHNDANCGQFQFVKGPLKNVSSKKVVMMYVAK